MEGEPVRHHYIPQFILRSFCYGETRRLHYYDKQTGKYSERNTGSVFLRNNLYRDEINRAENPVQTENDLSRFENEVSGIIRLILRSEDRIALAKAEYDKLMLFFAAMPLRSEYTRMQFKSFPQSSKAFYAKWQPNNLVKPYSKRTI